MADGHLLPALAVAASAHALLLFAIPLPEQGPERAQMRVTLSVAPGQRQLPATARAAADQSGTHAESSRNRAARQTAGARDAPQSAAPQGHGDSRVTPIIARRQPSAAAAGTGTLQPGGSPAAGRESGAFRIRDAEADLRAAYVAAWKQRVEEQGRRDFPFAALRRGGGDRLTLEVTVAADGRLARRHIRQGSGNPALDRAALEILAAAGPFATFPPALRERSPQLTFAYRWRFVAGERAQLSVEPSS